jgi:hypothetical protein
LRLISILLQRQFFALWFLISFLFAGAAWSQCASPTGTAGTLRWISASSKVMWCNGTSWVDTTNTTGSSCSGTTAGTINYASSVLRYCNGTNWISMKGASAGSCSGTTAGTFTYNSGANKFRFCDGTNWYNMEVAAANCTAPWGETVLHGDSVTAYAVSFSCGFPNECETSETRTCNNGVLSGYLSAGYCNWESCCSC